MSDPKSIMTIKDYGRIVYRFADVMDKKGITRNKLASLTGVRFEVADRLYKGIVERMDMDVLTRVCYVLDCQVGDVIQYDKNSK
ncbi:helix-turn-helix domain-containing protein [Christensenella minuta]|uniref:helix-turn-helix domain-containing protein n=1 Tax=Christensenella minuta TaxID=626937 RepID=UPI0021574CD1|nr:helix-turn-helix transcriptional regulator [Christensenella minuta]